MYRFTLAIVLATALTAASFAGDPPWPGGVVGSPDLATARAEAAVRMADLSREEWLAGRGSLEAVHTWSVRRAEAEADAGRAGAWSEHLGRMTGLERSVEEKVGTGMEPPASSTAVAWYVADARFRAQGGR